MIEAVTVASLATLVAILAIILRDWNLVAVLSLAVAMAIHHALVCLLIAPRLADTARTA
ncbi:MAG: hypothetical protein ACTSU0_05305 [Alphaproteobacteria bacterium]